MNNEMLFNFFKQHGFEYENHCHEPIFTVEEGRHLSAQIPGAHSKNLFLKGNYSPPSLRAQAKQSSSIILTSILLDCFACARNDAALDLMIMQAGRVVTLKDKKKSFFLVSVLEDKRVNLKLLAKTLGKSGLSFASAEELQEKLKLTPGSVTPYGLMNDTAQEVNFILDADLVNYVIVNFHPLRNDMTVSLPITTFLEFFKLINHNPVIMPIPVL